jgi:hypothetical protein
MAWIFVNRQYSLRLLQSLSSKVLAIINISSALGGLEKMDYVEAIIQKRAPKGKEKPNKK